MIGYIVMLTGWVKNWQKKEIEDLSRNGSRALERGIGVVQFMR